MQKIRMKYRDYKQHYADCETLGDYDKYNKTITVLIPDGRMKESGVRGKSFKYFTFKGIENGTNRPVRITIKAISAENAKKRLPTDCVWDVA